ncbi:hypothetical protein PBI_COLTRANE_58 [Microbacterium phage Coltrane]|uniref:Uncharacterized protein n=6 Tax=Armstrongvirus armstrong TaxID=2734217 RepID=A0A3G2KD86_9CAUD|nr:hypothetical protein HOU45_gp58 [Microbacterium phage Armstrong]AYN55929.1 hypothetical protein PBI_BRAHMS_58 [Microbacterium phage Brahms]AYN57035.1 hypothetical protein PBI_BERNSTEIN_58 [Microbacterium phage Bernstein]AYN57394.1 hypothetical protein PBI_COLTRANE_58 [Microbacterium phage Coltrane]AYN58982.1 hypothetical protein PBI_ROLLINS_58 [Microbacterium phage Rollins]QED11481.1 hypothetical protein SEA_VITAS_58 [Microbacterium phage Vitas]UOK18213.1 hypothetical protein SEA_CLAYDA5_6
MSRVLAFPGDTILMRTPGHPPIDREYRVTGSGGGRLTLEPVLPTEDGFYMTTNNVPSMSGVLIQLDAGEWTVLGNAPDTGSRAKRQVEEWNESLGLTRIYLTTTPPAKKEPF